MSGAEPVDQPAEVYGAAAERTELAWQRTAVGVVVASFVVCHTGIQLDQVWIGAIAALLGMVIAGLFVFGFPTGRHSGFPTGRHSGFPTGRHSGFPTGRHTGLHTDRHRGFPIDRHRGFPIDRHRGFPTDRPVGAPTDRHPGRSTPDTWSLLLIAVCSTTAIGALSLVASVATLLS